MVLRVVSLMLIALVIVLVVCQWNPRTAYTVLQHSQHLFEPDDQAFEHPKEPRAARLPTRRPYISPLVKKRVAARQKWRCAACKSLLDETYEIDHKIPLFKLPKDGSVTGTDESNLQALCPRCHMLKSAVEQSSR